MEETISRLKKAREVNEEKKEHFKRGIPGTVRKEESGFNFTIDKKFKPSFEDVQKKQKQRPSKLEKKHSNIMASPR